ncbi:MAG: ABC transporter permease, partial [Clostridiales bacterium]|nr:ABC transporter permease [Clostridiales bacterium]
LIVIFVFAAGMSITLESVAGEKERGTLATILVTSVKRSHVALGKVLPLSCIAAIGAASSFLGVALSMPKLMGISVGGVIGGYSAGSYLLLFMLILSVVPCIVAAITAVSTFSNSVKEASAYTSFLMIFMMVLTLGSAFVAGIGEWIVAIPVLNAVSVMQSILAGGVPVWQSFVALGVNLLFTALLIWLISVMLGNERIMFGK